MRERKISESERSETLPGDELIFVSGEGDSFCHATVKVVEKMRKMCRVRMVKVDQDGNNSLYYPGAVINADWNDLRVQEM